MSNDFSKTERRWKEIPARTLLASGTVDGVITVTDACDFKVKHDIILQATGVPPIQLEVKRVTSKTTLEVGPKGNIQQRTDVSAYTTGVGATIEAKEQNRTHIEQKEYERAVYEEEPTMAKRVCLVDPCGNKTGTPDNPLSVDATLDVGDLSVDITLPNIAVTSKITAPGVGEFAVILPNDTKQFRLRDNDGSGRWDLAYAAGNTAIAPIPIFKRKSYESPAVDLAAGFTIYLKAKNMGDCIYLEVWRQV